MGGGMGWAGERGGGAMVMETGEGHGDLDGLDRVMEGAVGRREDTRAMGEGAAGGLPGVVSGVGFYLAQEVSTNPCYCPTTMRRVD